jgi:hypothetical protein
MKRIRIVVGIGLATALAIPLGGCTGKVRIAVARMCQAHGGTYSAATQQCTYPASTKAAQEYCQQQGGYYDPTAQYCEIGRD